MLCESIRPLIRTFLDDLLDEKDYQEIQTHLGGCERCHAYASSVGTLSYRLYELGQVSVPPDMSSTILYGLEKQRRAAAVAPAASLSEEKSPKDMTAVVTQLFWAVVILIVVVTVAAVAVVASFRRAPVPAAVPAPGLSEMTVSALAPDGENPEQ